MTPGADQPLWQPSDELLRRSAMARFARVLPAGQGARADGYRALHRATVEHPDAFWSAVWDFCGVIGEKGDRVAVDLDRMPGARFFPDAALNFAENLLRRDDSGDAIVFRGEDGETRRLSWIELRSQVSRVQQLLLGAGVRPGDRVAAMVPNVPETVVCALATAAIGAVWSSCSPDFGVRGVLDRFGQIEPRVLIACDGYRYAGKAIAIGEKLQEIVDHLPSLELVLVIDQLGESETVAARVRNAVALDSALDGLTPGPIDFRRLPFDHPLYILYSSGTTGMPKALVHSAGGTLLQHLKEHRLHCDIRPDDRVFYFTTCGWMMWNWLVSALASEATLLLYDGSPTWPACETLFDFAEQERMTHFGTSAKFIDFLGKAGSRPARDHDLSSVRLVASTGSPLSAEGFRYVYDAVAPHAQLASISGGTDIVSCFVLGNPLEPVWPGEIQGPGLGMAVEVWDDDGRPLAVGKGELVCTRPFPSMPIGLWNDPDGSRYRATYFERFPGVWHHGDYAEWTSHGGLIIHGRSDATLNPGGVRIGTGEIYAVVERLPEVAEALAIGEPSAGDVSIVLFVRLAGGAELDEALERRIRATIREQASPRHVPARIVAVADIPRTKSGKIAELAVSDVCAGREVRNREALANPEALDLFVKLRAPRG